MIQFLSMVLTGCGESRSRWSARVAYARRRPIRLTLGFTGRNIARAVLAVLYRGAQADVSSAGSRQTF